MFCPKCGKDLTGMTGGFCGNCGTKIESVQPSQQTAAEAVVFCAKCGAKNKAGLKFCENCGVVLSAEKKKKVKKFPAKIIIPAAAALLIIAGVLLFFSGNKAGFGLPATRDKKRYIGGGDGLFTENADGSDRRMLTDDSVWNFNIHGNSIYYTNRSDGDSIYTIKTDGSDRRKLNDDAIESIWNRKSDNRIYYYIRDEYGYLKAYSIKPDGSGRKKLTD